MLPPCKCERMWKISLFHILKRGKDEVLLILYGTHCDKRQKLKLMKRS